MADPQVYPGTDAQQQLTRRLRDRLQQASARFVQTVLTSRVDADVRFRLDVREPDRLTVEAFVGSDIFRLVANGAELHLEMQDAGNDPKQWVELCDRTFHALLTHELRIRVRRSLLGRTHGAIWVPLDAGGWNGEIFAYLGWGNEERFADWLRTSPPRPQTETPGGRQVQQSPSE